MKKEYPDCLPLVKIPGYEIQDISSFDAQFIAASRDMVPELARRLKEAREALWSIQSLCHSWVIAEETINCKHTYGDILKLVAKTLNQLEAMPEDK